MGSRVSSALGCSVRVNEDWHCHDYRALPLGQGARLRAAVPSPEEIIGPYRERVTCGEGWSRGEPSLTGRKEWPAFPIPRPWFPCPKHMAS